MHQGRAWKKTFRAIYLQLPTYLATLSTQENWMDALSFSPNLSTSTEADTEQCAAQSVLICQPAYPTQNQAR